MSITPSDVVVLCWGKPTESDLRACEIVRFLGVEPAIVDLAIGEGNGSVSHDHRRHICIVVAAETLAVAKQNGYDSSPAQLVRLAENVFVYGFRLGECHAALLRELSSGFLTGIQAIGETHSKVTVADDERDWCGSFTGLSFAAVNLGGDQHFTTDRGSGALDTLVQVEGHPFLGRVENRGSRFFLCSGLELADLNEPVLRNASPLTWFTRLVPLMMFLRGALGSRVWRNEDPRACVIIDDPLLTSRYGFLDYGLLVESIRQLKYSTCIAFIPWNYRRSDQKVTSLFAANSEYLHLCIHGCDHTRGEFAAHDFAALRGKAQVAVERMREHQRLSGLAFDKVMVFPQGLFSLAAMEALKSEGYLAAINTDLWPADGTQDLTLRDLIGVAVVREGGLPLFGRRYPRELAEFAMDLFLGKPVLVVEHHGFFRNGQNALDEFVMALNGLDDRLQWATVGGVCEQTSLTRIVAGDEVEIRFFTDRFSVTNTGAETRHYFLRKSGVRSLPEVQVNGFSAEARLEEASLQIRLTLDPGQTAKIVLLTGTEQADVPWKATWLHKVRVGFRRRMCEIRDNHVDTSRILSAIVGSGRARAHARKLQTALQ